MKDARRCLDDSKADRKEIGSYCTDDAGQCAKSQRILALHWPMIVFMCCLTHQVNLLMNDLLTKVAIFKTHVDQDFKTAFLC
jgi:hypothetical protein